jgi:hypothetical protein
MFTRVNVALELLLVVKNFNFPVVERDIGGEF